MSDLRMPDLNTVMLAGRLTYDPDLKYTANGKAYCKFSVANTRYYKQGGERKEETVFVDCLAWGAQAEYIGENIGKGRPVLIQGSLKSSEWEDKETGKKRKKLEINCARVTPLDWGNDQQTEAPTKEPRQSQSEPVQKALAEDDIPF